MQERMAEEFRGMMAQAVLLDEIKPPKPEQSKMSAGPMSTIIVRPKGKGRTTRWTALCTRCGEITTPPGKLAASKAAVVHAEEIHPNRARILTGRGR